MLAHVPSATAHGRAANGALSPSYFDDYYNRVHLRPSTLALGQISSAQTRSVEVWNAFVGQSLTLNQVLAANADGIAVTPPGTYPFTFAPNQVSTWQIGITPNGPGVVDAVLSWQFVDASDDVSLTITGNRLTAWTVLPDWSTTITETLTWLTDLGESVAGDQARTPLRGDPRRQWEATYIAYDAERQVAESLLYGVAARDYTVPVWWDGDQLAALLPSGSSAIPVATPNRDYAVGDQVLLWSTPTTYELAEVSAIAPTSINLAHPTVNVWQAGTRIWPCRTMALTDTPQISRKSDWLAGIPIRFEAREPCDWAAAAPTATYLGYPVLELRPDEAADLQAAYARKLVTLDNQVALPDVDDFSGIAWPTQSHPILALTRADQASLRSLLYWLQGRAQALWVPSWQNDVTLANAVATTDTSLTVRWCGIARYLYGLPGRKHLRIELTNGTILYRTATAVVENGQLTESLSLDSALGVAVVESAVRDISWMMLATLASDTVEIEHVTDGDGVASCTLSFAGVPAEEP